jgi:hypothetical protein
LHGVESLDSLKIPATKASGLWVLCQWSNWLAGGRIGS